MLVSHQDFILTRALSLIAQIWCCWWQICSHEFSYSCPSTGGYRWCPCCSVM